MARVLKGMTVLPAHPLTECTIPAFAFPAGKLVYIYRPRRDGRLSSHIHYIDIVARALMCLLCDFVVQWSLLLPVATIAANPASDVVAVFTRDAQCKFVYIITDIGHCVTYILTMSIFT